MTAPLSGARPRVHRSAAIGIVAGGVVAAGAVVGAAWAWAAPPIHGVVALTRDGDRVQAYLGDEGQNFFIAPALALGMLSVLAVVAAAGAWQWRDHRGPGMAAGLLGGVYAAAGLAALVGAELVHGRYGVVDVDAAPVSPDHRFHYFVEAPPVFFGHSALQIEVTLMLPVALAALTYALCVAFTARDDLGAYPAESTEVPAPNALARSAP